MSSKTMPTTTTIVLICFLSIINVMISTSTASFVDEYCKEYPNIEVTAAFATSDGSFYVFEKRYYAKIREFRRPKNLNTLRFNKLSGLFDEYMAFPVIEDGYPKLIANDWKVNTVIDAGFTYANVTYLLSGDDLWLFNNMKYAYGPIARTYFNFLNHSLNVTAIEYISYDDRPGTFYVAVPYRPFFSILYTTVGNDSTIKDEQINVEIDALAVYHRSAKLLEGIVVTNYSFNFFTGYWKTVNEFSTYPILQGFLYPNELFFGCPQTFCFAADVDTILLHTNDIGFVFRGKYFWQWFPSQSLPAKEAKLIIHHFHLLPSYVDASFTLRNNTSFVFKDDKVYKSNGKQKFNYFPEGSLFKEIPGNINAIWFHKDNDSVYFFKGFQVYRYDLITGDIVDIPISDFLGLPSYVDAAFSVNKSGKSYFLKRSFYYEFDASYIGNRYFASELSFEFLFGCERLQYNYSTIGFENYKTFAKRMAEFSPVASRASLIQLRQLHKRYTYVSKFESILLIAVAILSAAFVSAYVVYRKMRNSN